MNGKEFIYKDRAGVRLGDVSQRLTKQFSERYGEGKVVLVSPKDWNSNLKDKDDKCYFQVVAVERYFPDTGERQRRAPKSVALKDDKSLWEIKFNSDLFMFAQPVTKSGTSYGDVKDQSVMKTILKTERPFPSFKTRLLVAEKKELRLTPLQTSIEVVEGRIQALTNELNCAPPNSKTLQLCLQGSVLVTVNQGPIEIARVFLGSAGEYPQEDIDRLCTALQEFVGICGRALSLNNSLTNQSEQVQVDFQKELSNGYEKLKQELQQYLPKK